MHQAFNRSALAILALAIFYFVFLGSEYLFDSMMGLLVSGEEVVKAQSFILGTSVIGFLLYPLFANHSQRSARRILVIIGGVLYIASMITVYLHPSAMAVQAAGCLAFVILGIAGGFAHWTAAESFADGPYLARFVGFAYAGGLILQFLSNNLVRSDAVETMLLSAGLTALLAILIRTRPVDAPKRQIPESGTRQRFRMASCMIGAVAAMTCLFGTLDNVVTLADASGTVDVAAWPRLLLAASGLAAGFIYDIGRGRFMTLTVFCVALFSTLGILIMENGASIWLGLIIFYLSSGFFVVFFTSTFLSISLRMKVPQLWAGMGRVVNNTVVIIIGTPSLLLVGTSTPLLIEVIGLVLFVLIAVLLFSSGGLTVRQDAPRQPMDNVSRLAGFCNEYALARREQQILECVLENKADGEIAAQLFISVSTVRFHMSNILKKTGSASRTDAVRKAQMYQAQS